MPIVSKSSRPRQLLSSIEHGSVFAMDAWTEEPDDGIEKSAEPFLFVVLPLKMKSTSNVVTLKKLLTFSEINHSRQSLLFKNLLVCLDTLHSTGIYHDSIHVDNIWVEDLFYVSLGPFGLPNHSNAGQLAFKPPEQVLGNRSPSKETLFKADIWGIGIVFCVLRYGLYFADQLQLIENEEDYLKFCEVVLDFDASSDYTFASYQHLQSLKRKQAMNDRQEGQFDIGFLQSCRNDLDNLILLQSILNPEPQSRLTSKELLCIDLFKDCSAAFRGKKEQRQPTIETGSNRRRENLTGIGKSRAGIEGLISLEGEKSLKAPTEARIELQSSKMSSQLKERGNIANQKELISESNWKISTENGLTYEPETRKNRPLTPQNKPNQDKVIFQPITASETRLKQQDQNKIFEDKDQGDYRAMRDRREALRVELSKKEAGGPPEKTAFRVNHSTTTPEPRNNRVRDEESSAQESSDKGDLRGPRLGSKAEGLEASTNMQLRTPSLGPKDRGSPQSRVYNFDNQEGEDQFQANFLKAEGLKKHSFGYMGALADSEARPVNPSKETSTPVRDAPQNHGSQLKTKDETSSFMEDQRADASRNEKVSKPFFQSSNSNILETSAPYVRPHHRRDARQELMGDDQPEKKFAQTAPISGPPLTPSRRPLEGSMSDLRQETQPIAYVPKFDVERRENDRRPGNYSAQDSRKQSIDDPSGSKAPLKFDSRDNPGQAHNQRSEVGLSRLKHGPKNLTAIVKLSVVRFIELDFDEYKFVSGSLVFKRSILEDSNLAMDTEIKEARQELPLNSVFSISLPSTKIESTEDLRLDLTIYGHKEKSNFKRYLSSGCLDIRSPILSQLLAAPGQRSVESKWCLLRNTQRAAHAVVQVEVVVEDMAQVTPPPQREDSLEKTRSNQSTVYKRRREIDPQKSQEDQKIKITDENSRRLHSPTVRNDNKRGEADDYLKRSQVLDAFKDPKRHISASHGQKETILEQNNPSIKPNFSFGKIAGKPGFDQKEALKREIEELRSSIDTASNLQAYPKALGLLRELIQKGNSTNNSIEPN